MSDLLDIVEAAYSEHADFAGWLGGVANALEPQLGQGWGVGVGHMIGTEVLTYVSAGVPSPNDDPYLQGHGLTSRGESTRLMGQARAMGPIASMLSVVGEPTEESDPMHMREVVLSRGASDAVTVFADTMHDEYLGAVALRREPWRASRSTRGLWRRVSTHLGAGLRLRRQAAAASAVATPNGRIEHAEPNAQQRDSLAAISEAVRSTETARGRMRRQDPEQSLELWKGLVSGRWSLVDHFDSDGRRYILARENAPNPAGAENLTARQRAAVTLRARGHSLKHIGYELGLSVPTISVELREAMRVLGVRSALELGALFARSIDPRPVTADATSKE